jgi:hypothetical protein
MILEIIAVVSLLTLATTIVLLTRKPRPSPPFLWPPVTGPGVSGPGGGEVSEGNPND